jgi:predicted nucleotidyltransferase
MLDRETIIKRVADGLRQNDNVKALWEGGSVSFGREDQWSDIDLYVLVSDGNAEFAMGQIRELLAELAPIEIEHRVRTGKWPMIEQSFFRLAGMDEFLIIDIAVVPEGSEERFLEVEVHGEPRFLIRSVGIKEEHVDIAALRLELLEALEQASMRMELFSSFVLKELWRENLLDALDIFRAVVLSALVDILRIRYAPFHHDFRLRYCRHDLPDEVYQRLTLLSFIKDGEDLEKKFLEAKKWFGEERRNAEAMIEEWAEQAIN